MEDPTLYKDQCPNCRGGYDFSEEEARMEAEGLSYCYRVCTRCGMFWEVRKRGDKQPEGLEDFDGPDAYNKYLGRGFGAFTVATRNIMKQRNMTFVETCTFLEEQGYLSWAGDWPLYNLAGDVLWNKDYGKKVVIEYPEHHASYEPEKEMKCLFFSLVIRNGALEEKFEGGLQAFLKEYPYCCYNDAICVFVAMGYQDLVGPIEGMEKQGLIEGVDFVEFEPMRMSGSLFKSLDREIARRKNPRQVIPAPEPEPEPDFGVPWLGGYYLDSGGACMVYYTGDEN